MNKIVNFLQKYFAVISVLIGISILLSVTFSSYIVTSNSHKAAEMYIGELKYSIEIDGSSTNTLTVPTGETIIDVKVNNLNPVDTYYKLLYLKNTNITVKYYESTKDTDEVVTTYNKPNDSVTSSNSNTIKLLITNSSTSSQNIALTMKGGYITNTIQDITTPSTYSEISLVETPSTNTYFCKTSDTLTQGLEYVNGQYTYRYRQEGRYVSSDSIGWQSISNNGWGVQLTDKTSADAVTSKLCTYVNNKPVISYSYMFYKSQATTLDVSNFDTKNVTDMYGMFYDSQATALDLSSFDTSKVKTMSCMFYNIQATALDIRNFNTSKVTDMSWMFRNSQASTIKGLENFNTSKVTNMAGMFNNSQATTLDVSSFDTSKVTNMNSMFYQSQATTLDLSSFDTSKVTNMNSMFVESQATILDVSHFNTSNVTNMGSMFGGSQTTILDLSNFDTNKVTNMESMFHSSKATTLDLSSFNTSNVTNMSYMFGSSQATTLDLSSFDTSNVTDMRAMFSGSQATTLDLSKFNTSNVTNMASMFRESQAITLDLSNFDTSNVTDMSSMFSDSKAKQITGLDKFNTSNVTSMTYMFWRSQATTLDLSSFNTSNVTSMTYMFYNSSKLKTIYTSDKFNTSAVTDDTYMFQYCTSLVGGSGTTYNSSYVDKTYAKIDGGTSSPGYFTDIADVPNSFSTDSWKTIIKAVKNNNISKYNVGDTKTIDMGSYGTHTLRIANTSTPSECSTSGFSQTACGFVLEFADIITKNNINSSSTNAGGWPNTSMRTFVNNDIYNSLPSELKNGIIDTTVISSHGSEDSSNFISTDKLYLLAPTEIYSDWKSNSSSSNDTAKDLTRQLDYYMNEKVSSFIYAKAIKTYNSNALFWWLRSAFSSRNDGFLSIDINGDYDGRYANYVGGVSPAFRIG